MPRPPRLEVPGALYHVTARGNVRRALYDPNYSRSSGRTPIPAPLITRPA